MARAKKKARFRTFIGYGWRNISISDFTERMQTATIKVDLLREKHKFDAIAFCGSSGSAAAFILGVALQIPLIYVRKNNEHSHGSNVDGNAFNGVSSYLIVDDFIDTGATMKHIIESIRMKADDLSWIEPKCVGAFLYDPSSNQKTWNLGNGEELKLFY